MEEQKERLGKGATTLVVDFAEAFEKVQIKELDMANPLWFPSNKSLSFMC